MQPWAAKRCDAIGCGKGTLGRAVDDTMDPYITSCAPFGIPRLMNHAGPLEILQTPGRVLMLFETGNSQRQIWTDGRGHPADLDSTWMGNSIGRWDGDTLVVDTIGQDDKTVVDNYRTPHSAKIHVVERWKMINDGQKLQVTYTVDDPDAFNAPWSAIRNYRRVQQPMSEEVCAENNRNLFDYHIPVAAKPDF